ncbi:unnamed protein product [Paramecium octaurelia]|uniref:WD-40 repeat protein n=1 Tax=Paramecium octaurelia TaxID=43137 RepID=A0A8S1YM02_PAROT|nr:unnamed protein product [Paramecium octaurelia]
MSCWNQQKEDLYEILALSKDVDEVVIPILIIIFKREKIQDENQRQVEQEIVYLEYLSLLNNQQILNVVKNNIKKIIVVLNHILDHDFTKENYSFEEQKQVQDIKNISNDIELVKFLVHITALDKKQIQRGSNSLHLLVEMKLDLKEQSFENIRIRSASLFGTNLVRSEFEKLFNYKWRNLSINQGIKLICHNGSVNSVCFSLYGKTLASCSDDHSICLWDVRTGKKKSSMQGQSAYYTSFLHWHFCVYLEYQNRKISNEFIGHSDTIFSVCFSPECNILASGSRDNSIRLWDVKIGQQKQKLDGHTNNVYSVCFSPDGTKLASGSYDNSIRLWDLKTGQQKAQLDNHTSTVYSVCFSPDGKTLASGSSDNFICLWDVKTGKLEVKLDGHDDQVQSVCFSPDGTQLVSGSYDKSIRLWDLKTGQQIAHLDSHTSTVYSVCFSSDGKTLASGSEDKSIRLYDTNLDSHNELVNSIYFSLDDTSLESVNKDDFIRLSDIKTSQKILSSNNSYK